MTFRVEAAKTEAAASFPPAPPGVFALVLVLLAVLLFTRLGWYALWDDETMVALVAQGVNHTGDTSVLMDHGNIVGYDRGILIRDFRDRSTPPLATYITAASFSLFGVDAWTARWPFAFLGLCTYALILFWARRLPWPWLVVLAIGLLGNVSLLLNFRQCRYYAPTIFFSVAVVFVYWCWAPRSRPLLIMAALSILLFVSNYLECAALYACLFVDYAFWKRKEWRLGWREAALLFGPQVVIDGLIAGVWNPLRTGEGDLFRNKDMWDRLVLIFGYWRDTNAAEFLALPIVLLALVVGLAQRRTWLVRGCVALAVYFVFISLFSPQEKAPWWWYANIRYVPAIIPLAIALEAGFIGIMLGRRPWLAIGAAVLLFGTNLFNGGPLLADGLRSTLVAYLGELTHPVPEPYTPTADWINANVPEGESVLVSPDYSAYPLMFHAPRALYAWQFDWPPRPDFVDLPTIQFKGRDAPDYIVGFGPLLNQAIQGIQKMGRPDVSYAPAAMIPVYWKDAYRPELFWHAFTPPRFDPNSEAVYIFRRVNPPIVPPPASP
jgi:hypothetical protein